MIHTTHYQSPLGDILLASQDGKLIGLWIEGQKLYLTDLDEGIIDNPTDPVLVQTQNWLNRYFAGDKPKPDELPLAPIGSDFRQQVWQILQTIPYGQTTTYKQIADTIAKKRGIKQMSAQAVGGAVGHNPISIIIPCHRVVGTDGSLTGYAGSLDKKTFLLHHEFTTTLPKIAEITDQDFGFNTPRAKTGITRFCTRILLFNDQNEICVVKSEKYDYLQLPGGGIEENETIGQALRRETEEETGYLINNIKPLGYTVEKREDARNAHDWERGISFVFKASPTRKVGTKYMPDEIEEGFTPIWINFDDFIKIQAQREGHIQSYSGNFSNRRDLAIAKYYTPKYKVSKSS